MGLLFQSVITICCCHSNQEEEPQEEEDVDKLKKKCEVWWGLSDSSINLAKELLPTEYITLSPSKEISFLSNGLPAPSNAVAPVETSDLHTTTEGSSAQAAASSTGPSTTGDGEDPIMEAKEDVVQETSSSEDVITKQELSTENVKISLSLEYTVEPRIMDMFGTQVFVLCREVVLFWRLFCIHNSGT